MGYLIITDEKLYLHSISDHVIFGLFPVAFVVSLLPVSLIDAIALQDDYACARLLLDLSLPPGYLALLESPPRPR